jgi:hypothetical protein
VSAQPYKPLFRFHAFDFAVGCLTCILNHEHGTKAFKFGSLEAEEFVGMPQFSKPSFHEQALEILCGHFQ